jgi:acyl carrier protein
LAIGLIDMRAWSGGECLVPEHVLLEKREWPEAIMEDIANVIRHFILDTFLPGEDPSELTDQTPLITGGILDSISTLKLVVFLEEHFGIRIEAYEAGVEHLDSISQITALVHDKQTTSADAGSAVVSDRRG